MNNINLSNGANGFTVLEAVISAAVFFIITFSAANLLLFAAVTGARISQKQELLENGRVAMEFILSHIRAADEIALVTDMDFTLKELRATVNAASPSKHTYVFAYDKTLPDTSLRHHRLEFGGNELASYVNDIQMQIGRGDIITITITMDERIEDGGPSTVVQVFTGQTGLRYKKVKVSVE